MLKKSRSTSPLLLCCFFFLYATTGFTQTRQIVPAVLIVKLKATPQTAAAHRQAGVVLGRPSLDALNRSLNIRRIQTLFRAKKKTTRTAGLTRIVKIVLPAGVKPREILSRYQKNPDVEYAQFNHLLKIDAAPNDPLFPRQTALQVVQAEEAWELQTASPEVIVGVIDTGIDYGHQDLRDAIWINSGEDLNGNGRVDSTDFNGLDEDQNGFVDDIQGWDFTDAPAFPDGGDFRTPDNDPFDENGHGTSVAGIIGATGNNSTGIAGLAYGCRLMNLRAGTSQGFLEEDDVASAIVYAVENGARIINMSFGDVVASPLLQDVMQFAYQHNCILVASAGNSATDAIHFPSGFSETISVGATDLQDNLAGFSNYGSSVDLVAPGLDIFTTKRNNDYGGFSGTSASAPLVSALAALVLSKTPEHSAESLKGLLVSSTDDLGDAGWDNFFAAGRINALKAVQSPYLSVAKISHPQVNQGFAHATPVPVTVTATGTFLQEVLLQLGVGETPAQWQELTRVRNRQIVREDIFDLDISSLADTLYTLRLVVQNKNGTAVEDKVPFFIDNSEPRIANVKVTPMLDGELQSVLVEFSTDDLCDASVFVRSNVTAGRFEEIPLRFRATEHRFLVRQFIAPGRVDFYVRAVNTAGLVASDDNDGMFYEVDFDRTTIPSAPVEKLTRTLPAGFFLSKTSDFDGDGNRELIFNQYQGNFNFGKLKILEIAADRREEIFTTDEIFIPRDWGDSDSDGRSEILAGNGPRTFIFEALSPGGFPEKIVWADTTGEVWGSRFSDLDGDGRGEIILRLDDLYTVWESAGDNAYALVDSLPNPTEGTNVVGVPHTETGDFDGDGLQEILFGDFDGDLILYENRGDNRYESVWSERMPLTDATDYLAAGDFDGDGVDEFVAGTHTDENLDLESNFDSRHWLFRIYKSSAGNVPHPVWEQAFFGFQSPKDFDSGVSAGDVDNDGRDELLISIFPHFYLVDFSEASAEYQVVWHTQPARSNTAVIADFDADGGNEFYFNDGSALTGYRFLAQFTGPPTPTAFKVRPLGPQAIELTWQPFTSANGFQIYRAADENPRLPIDHVLSPPFVDSSVVTGVTYSYAVAALDSALSPPESLLTPALSATPNEQPFLQSARFSPPAQIILTFSEAMGPSANDQTHYAVSGSNAPTSAIGGQSGRAIIVTVPGLTVGRHDVTVFSVTDRDGTPIDTSRNSATFDVVPASTPPYLVNARLTGDNSLELTFNEAMDPVTTSDTDNYRIEPNVRLQSAALSPEDPQTVLLTVDPRSPIGPFGIDYFIRVRDLKSRDGRKIEFGLGDTAALIFSNPDLRHVFAYPNPYRADSGQDYVTIAGLTREATVRIFDVTGKHLRTLNETDGNGGLRWDLKDEAGAKVPSGVYVIYVTSEGKKGTAKVAVLW